MKVTAGQLLSEELESRSQKNPRYSLRAFAKTLGTSHAYISQVLRDQRKLSVDKGSQIAKILRWDREKTTYFLNLLSLDKAKTQELRARIQREIEENPMSAPYFSKVREEHWDLLLQWPCAALWSRIDITGLKEPLSQIAEEYRVPEVRLGEALQKFIRYGYLRREKNVFVKIVPHLHFGDVPNQIVRQFQKTCLTRAQTALDRQEFSERDHTAGFIALKPDNLAEFRREIREFHNRLAALAEPKTSADCRVYCLAVQLFDYERASL